MNRKFTELTTVLMMTALCALPLAGQEKVAVKMEPAVHESVQLRADDAEALPDSLITYSSAGEKLWKRVWAPRDDETRGWYSWNHDSWVYVDGNGPYPSSYVTTSYFDEETNSLFILHMGMSYEGRKLDSWYSSNDPNDITYYPVYATYNEKGQLISVEVKQKDIYRGTDNFYSYYFIYDEKDQIVSIVAYNYDWKATQYDYQYNENGDLVDFEKYSWRYEDYTNLIGLHKWIYSFSLHMVAKYDSKGRKTGEERYLGHETSQKYLLNEYDIYYYSDGNVANEPLADMRIWSYGGNLHVRTAQSAVLHVYTPAGALHAQQALPAGETAFPLPPGIYIVKVGNATEKIVIGK